MENVTDWFSSDIRREVYTEKNQLSTRFIEWQKNRVGKFLIQRPRSDDGVIIYKIKIFFERQEDLVDYLLSFEEMQKITDVDAAAFYAPYVPLTVSNVSGNIGVLGPNIISFNTRYGLVDSTSNTDGDI
jgi:hypothetical protein